MAGDIPIVRKLQADALNSDVTVSALIRLAKVVATKLDLKEALIWIDQELEGYENMKLAELPSYRQLSGSPKFFNPYHGWRPIVFEDAKEGEVFSRAPISQSLGSIEETIRNRKNGTYMVPYSSAVKNHLIDALGLTTDFAIFLTYGQLWAVVDAVRNLILNWSLELEKKGVLGESMTFTATEKKDAGPVTHKFIIQNVGVLGNVSDHAQVHNQQTAIAGLDLARVQQFLDDVRGNLAAVPTGARIKLEPILVEAEYQIKASEPNQPKLRELIASIKSICEGVASNIISQGIISMASSILG
jgi:AbiTii-like protein